MITLSIDRRPDAQGSIVDDISEYQLLIDYMIECSTLLKSCLFVPPSLLKERLAFINKTIYFCSIELRLKNNFMNGNGSSIYFKDNEMSRNIANFIYSGACESIDFEQHPAIGYYHGIEQNGYDFFLENSVNSAIIIYIDYIANAKKIAMNRKHFCAALCASINELF